MSDTPPAAKPAKKTSARKAASPAVEPAAAAPAPLETVNEGKPPKADKHDKKVKKDKKDKKAKKAKKNKEAVMLRFEEEQLSAIDARADALGLSRAAWVRMVVAKVLAG